MKRVLIDPGICGLPTTVAVTRTDRTRVRVEIASECEQVKEMAQLLGRELDVRRAFGPMCKTAVYEAAGPTLRHAACPVPMAVLKAIEAEVGAALPKDVTVTFETAEGETDRSS